MKKIKTNKLLIIYSAPIILSSLFLTSCTKIDKSKKNTTIENIIFRQENINSLTIEIDLNDKINSNEIQIIFNENLNYNIKIFHQKVVVYINGLEQNKKYNIKELIIKNQVLNLDHFNKEFYINKNNAKNNNILISGIIFENITQNSVDLSINFKNLTQEIEDVKFQINNNLVIPQIIDLQKSKFRISNLNSDTTYNIQSIILDNKEILIKNNNVFKTLVDTSSNSSNVESKDFYIKNVFFNEIKQNSAVMNISFSKKQIKEIQNNTFEILLNNGNSFVFENYSPAEQYNFLLNNLESNTEYSIKSIKFNGEYLIIKNNYSFRTLRTIPNKNNLYESLQNKKLNYQFYDNYLNIEKIKSFNFTNNEVYKNYLKEESNKNQFSNQTDSVNPFENEYELINSFTNENNLTAYFKILKNNPNSFYVNYQDLNKNHSQQVSKQLSKVQESIYKLTIENINDNFVLINSISQNNSTLKNKEIYVLFNKKTNENSDNYTISNNSEWHAYDKTENNTTKLYYDSTIYSKNNQNLPEFYWKYLDKNNNVQSVKLDSGNSLSSQFRVIINDKTAFKKSIGLFFKQNQDMFYINNQEEIKLLNDTKENLIDAKNKYKLDISKIQENQDKIQINYNSNLFDKLTDVKLIIKSTNPFEPFVLKIDTELNKNNNTISFNKNLLPSEINEFIITNSIINNEHFNTYYLNDSFKFKINKNYSELTLENFKVTKDSNNLFGHLKFNFTDQNIKFFKNKVFKLVFDVDTNKNSSYEINFIDKPFVFVNFKDLEDFKINKFQENIKYTLKNISLVEPYTFNEIVPEINKTQDYTFVNIYDDQLNKDQFNEEFINFLNTSNVDFTQENFLNLIKYQNLYKTNSDILPYKEKVFFNNTKNIDYKTYIPREILEKTIFKINNHSATITKDLSEINNLNSFEKENLIFSFSFELELSFKKPIDNYKNKYKPNSVVHIDLPYSQIYQKKNIQDYKFYINSYFENLNVTNVFYNKIKDLFSFDFELIDDKLILKINNKKNIKIFDSIVSHNLSIAQSAYLGSLSYKINYVGDNEFIYNQKPLENQKYTGLNEKITEQSEYSNVNTENNALRLYKEDKDKVIDTYRQRAFTFKDNGGSWTVIGKVLPNNPNDFRFYITSNDHVWKTLQDATQRDKINNPTINKIDKLIDIKVPKIVDKQTATSNNSETYVSNFSTKWKNEIEYKFELISNFFDPNEFQEINKLVLNDLKTHGGVDKFSDNVFAIVDFAFFFKNFELNKSENWIYKNQKLNQKEIEIVEFIHNLLNIKTLQVSKLNKNVNNNINFNYYIAGFSAKKTANQFSPLDNTTKRWREYLIGNSIKNLTPPIYETKLFGRIQMNNPFITTNTNNVDISGGFSGSGLYDSQGNFAGYHVLGDPDDGFSNKYAFLIDTQEKTIFGDGSQTFNPISFYEKIRLLSYLYPNKYSSQDFKNKPEWDDNG
ncbi:hypothetical protein [Mycoplasma leonicaptivi]|uniref:hypothetical protein n=1 Tax=Mycoplasma leonicaptivi TaxID=36742 RepID=UPI0012EB573A|nr:hypothetical protein [Mycoplasma leonicaptivi]